MKRSSILKQGIVAYSVVLMCMYSLLMTCSTEGFGIYDKRGGVAEGAAVAISVAAAGVSSLSARRKEKDEWNPSGARGCDLRQAAER